jgi:hypothetical protein
LEQPKKFSLATGILVRIGKKRQCYSSKKPIPHSTLLI